jgi:hypothetical protein
VAVKYIIMSICKLPIKQQYNLLPPLPPHVFRPIFGPALTNVDHTAFCDMAFSRVSTTIRGFPGKDYTVPRAR